MLIQSDGRPDEEPSGYAAQNYSLTFSVDYPERLSRLSTAFRLPLVIPILVILVVVIGPEDIGRVGGLTATWGVEPYFRVTLPTFLTIGGLLVLAPLLMILFLRKYPRWWFDWNLQLLRFQNRVNVYLFLLRDEYPSTDEEQAVHLDMRYPDAVELNRWLPLVKWLLAIPHYLILFVLGLVSLVAVVIAWFAILITGRYPRALFDFIVGFLRWNNRVIAYAFVLTTDRYPPFRLMP
jgi:Domain of unknown function (DUF4389)